MEFQYDPDKNHIKLKFCTEVREHHLSDQKKAPSSWPWESPLQAKMHNDVNHSVGQNFDVTKIISIRYCWKDNLILNKILGETKS